MSVLIAITIGLLVTVAVLQLLQRDIIRIVVGLYTLWNAVNLLLISVAATWGSRAPMLDGSDTPMTDPLVQAFVLTSIVITFGFTALLVAIVSWLAHSGHSIDLRAFEEERD
jgi:multisubunit Na+/H+ antiporter MnhC subunit